VLYCLVASGRPFPATFYAKATGHAPFSGEQWGKVLAVLGAQPFSGARSLGGGGRRGRAARHRTLDRGLMRLRRAGWPALVLVGLFGPLFLAGAVVTVRSLDRPR